MSLSTTLHGTPCNESCHRRKTPTVGPPLGHSCCLMQYGSTARPQRFGSEINNSNPPMSAPIKLWEVDARVTEPTCTEPAHSSRFVGAQHDRARHPPRGPCGAPRSQRHSAHPMAWTGSSRIPTFANAAGGAALRNGTAAVVGTKHNAASAQQNNRSSASHLFSANSQCTTSRH